MSVLPWQRGDVEIADRQGVFEMARRITVDRDRLGSGIGDENRWTDELRAALLRDQIRASSQKPSVELMQLLVCACETVARITFIATANVNQTTRLIPSLIRRLLPRCSVR